MLPSATNPIESFLLAYLHLPSLQDVHVLVIGDVMLDRYWHGNTSRISPEAPVPIVDIERSEDRPGGAANVALNVVSLGAKCTLLGCVGADEAGALLVDKLQAAGVECDFVEVPDWPTTMKLRVLSQRQQLLRSDFESPTPETCANVLMEKLRSHIGDATVLIVEDYDKGAISDAQAIMRAAAAKNVPVVVDPKAKPFSNYAGASLLKPNRLELEAIVDTWTTDIELGERAAKLCRDHDIAALVVTLGGAGMSVIAAGQRQHLPARAVDVFDVTGAGDTAAAVLGIATGLGWSAIDAARLANVASSIVVTKSGTATVSGPELALAVQADEHKDKGMLTREQVALAVQLAKQAGEKVVFTNGCFDILHAGHVSYLEEARALGDRLVVAVNDDASVTRLKGAGRPVNELQRRLRVLAGLASVDWVVGFTEDTPVALLEELEPNVLVKGGDYGVDAVVGAEVVAGYGGEVRVLGLVEDCSTTEILEKVRG